MWHNSIIDTIGKTPLIKLHTVTKDLKPTVLAKVEYFNPGQSVKDRIALKMIEDGERDGKLKPGYTIIEGTSGNTGLGLALAAAVRGYKCIFTTTDKQSMEKVNILRALGAEVRICPTNVEPDDPRSYYSVAKRLSEEIQDSWYPNQYDNLSNTQAHFESTGPEIWEQTEGKITHFVAGMGTGGTITGVSKYLKSKNESIKVIGIDSIGSVYKKYFETGEFDKKVIGPYLTEGIGEDIIPANMDFSFVDAVVQCPDKDAFLTTRALARKEGLFVGGSCGSAVWGAIQYIRQQNLGENDVVVVLLPDSGTRYVSKIYNDEWMESNGFIETASKLKAIDIAAIKPSQYQDFFTADADDTVGDAIRIMQQEEISQMPVIKDGVFVGSLSDNRILNRLIADPQAKSLKVSDIMNAPFPVIKPDMPVDKISSLMDKDTSAVVVKLQDDQYGILTKSDLIHALASTEETEINK
jgi:cystathionine beta-synthase